MGMICYTSNHDTQSQKQFYRNPVGRRPANGLEEGIGVVPEGGLLQRQERHCGGLSVEQQHRAGGLIAKDRAGGGRMKARPMPKQGYYVYKNRLTGNNVNVVYTTGVPGKGGHMYYRVFNGNNWGWSKLLWTCVPSVEEAAMDYTYYPELPTGIPPKPEKA